ncbi:glycosyltransferase WbsX family protein [Lacticaseibacillus paracasei]|uniref:glycosyltransferase WbsX family protein n=1 Tax=Lacticaseibacillus paracasei TaxID=1597 RepID=UPI0007BFCC81|nr:glycoside hydrolase family 99-like domain-containing protein [Lacticaseibacillus paracasei]URW90610.1 glycoside hydrolase family 99-like domain-containing protein [Lacticaseibacillus paracasei]
MTKIISFYLPQFHSIPENDAVWGKGFTEWNNVKAAKPLVKKQYQPRVPLNNNYYSLLNEDTILWQTDLAKKYGVYGFCIYHYWFSGKLLLNKPLELINKSKKIHFPYCICWANESWTNAWSSNKPKSFLEQKYGDKAEWKEHFDYLARFFKDPDYIVEDNKPLMVIYRPESIPQLNEKLDFWNSLARAIGFDGLEYAYQQMDFEIDPLSDDSRFKYSIEYQPRYALQDIESRKESQKSKTKQIIKKVLRTTAKMSDKTLKTSIIEKREEQKKQKDLTTPPQIISYDEVCEAILQRYKTSDKSVAGMFVGYDDTPRRQNRGSIIQSTPESFEKYLTMQLKNIQKHYSTDFLFLFAWNEWAEGGYLEPDQRYRYQYLESIDNALRKTRTQNNESR